MHNAIILLRSIFAAALGCLAGNIIRPDAAVSSDEAGGLANA